MFNAVEGTVIIFVTLYFRYISKDWRGLVTAALIENVIGTMLHLIIVPESPKWLFEKKRFKECSQVLL